MAEDGSLMKGTQCQSDEKTQQSDETNKLADEIAQPCDDRQDCDANSRESVARNQAGVTDTFKTKWYLAKLSPGEDFVVKARNLI